MHILDVRASLSARLADCESTVKRWCYLLVCVIMMQLGDLDAVTEFSRVSDGCESAMKMIILHLAGVNLW